MQKTKYGEKFSVFADISVGKVYDKWWLNNDRRLKVFV